MIFFYIKHHFKRCVWQESSLVLLIAAVLFFFTIFDGYIHQKEADIENAYSTIPVTVVVSNISGTKVDNLELKNYIINYFVSDRYVYNGELQEKAFSSYLKDIRLKGHIFYNYGEGFSTQQILSGITSAEIIPELSPISGNTISFLREFDEAVFSSNEPVCIVPDSMLELLSLHVEETDSIVLTVQMTSVGNEESSQDISMEIIGTYPSESQIIYCPYACMAAIQTELDGKVTGDSLCATIKNNNEIENFREILSRHFAEVDPSGHQKETSDSSLISYLEYAVTIHDETLRDTVTPLHRNLQLLCGLKPLFIVIVLLLVAAAGFLFLQIRRKELAIARSLGTRRLETFMMAIIEVSVLFAIGLALSVLSLSFIENSAVSLFMVLAVLASVNGGAAVATVMSTGKHGIRNLQAAGGFE